MIGAKVVCRVALVGVVVLAAGCRAHTQASAQMNVGSEAEDHKFEVPETELPPPASPSRAAAAPSAVIAVEVPVDRQHFVGVVHDLMLAPAARRNAVCQCLAVDYGIPNDPKFVWQTGAPRTDAGTLAVAVAADGVDCSARGYAPHLASISAVQSDGDDLVLVMENVREGAPVVHGALVVPPGPAGALVVRARGGAPYGAPLAGGHGPCRLKMMATPR